MADAENRGPAEPSQAAAAAGAAAQEVMAQGGKADVAATPQTPSENSPKPRNDFLESLPNSVKCRVLALKKLQRRCDKIEAKFDKEFQALEKKYNDIYKPLLAKIQELTGEMEGCAWTLEGEDEDEDDYEDEEEDEEEEEEQEEEQEEGGRRGSEQRPGA
ncbi:nucleosome assembly protein 1-like 5 [Heterocephalus glaber]|uniref:Nucleosome assembly protein 1-like 5 n=1 Tax=Heterocephalus glaber TaxID=10181 RepID=A0AAX6PBT2_HETGA|nr:nucleosome assembly protein 1-like 5 [Heterocephalus glaber]